MIWLQNRFGFTSYLVSLSFCSFASEAFLWSLKHAGIIPFAKKTDFPNSRMTHPFSFIPISTSMSSDQGACHSAKEHPLSFSISLLFSFPEHLLISEHCLCLSAYSLSPFYQIFSSMRTGALSINVGWMEICSIKN